MGKKGNIILDTLLKEQKPRIVIYFFINYT
jgi:hypothetical protein